MNDSRSAMTPLRSKPFSIARTLFAIFFVGVTALGSTSCGVTTKKYPVERVLLAQNERDLWNSMRVAINSADYPVGAAGADPVNREIVTGWRETFAPFRKSSNRKRIIVKFSPFKGGIEKAKEALGVAQLDSGLEVFDVSIRVQKDRNKSLRSIDPQYADWTADDDDLKSAERVMMSLISYLGTEQFQLHEPEKLPFQID